MSGRPALFRKKFATGHSYSSAGTQSLSTYLKILPPEDACVWFNMQSTPETCKCHGEFEVLHKNRAREMHDGQWHLEMDAMSARTFISS